MKTYTVYKIVRQRNGECFYVGATSLDLETRLYQHAHAPSSVGEWVRNNKHSIVEVARYTDPIAAQEHETLLIAELKPKLNTAKSSFIATHAGGRTNGAKNKKPTRSAYIYVRLTDELKDWVLAQAGKSDSDKVVSILEDCRQNHNNKRREKAS